MSPECAPTGIHITSTGGIYHQNFIFGTTTYAMFYNGSGFIDATNNYWRDPSGPLDTSDDRTTGGLYNPNGLGDKVSDHINYDPWMVSNPVQLMDAIIALQVSCGIPLIMKQNFLSDINNDGKINIVEVIWVLQRIAEINP